MAAHSSVSGGGSYMSPAHPQSDHRWAVSRTTKTRCDPAIQSKVDRDPLVLMLIPTVINARETTRLISFWAKGSVQRNEIILSVTRCDVTADDRLWRQKTRTKTPAWNRAGGTTATARTRPLRERRQTAKGLPFAVRLRVNGQSLGN